MKTYITMLALLGLVLITAQARGQAAADADVKPLLADVAAAYRGLTAFSATMETSRAIGPMTRTVTTKFIIQKPNKLWAEILVGEQLNRVVSDGTKIYSDKSLDKTIYTEQPVEVFGDLVMGLSRSNGIGVGLLPILLTSPNAENQIIPGKPTSISRLPDETVSDVPCDIVTVVFGVGDQGNRYTFAFGKQDHLLRRLTIGPITAGAKPAMTETFTNVRTTPIIADATFKCTPAPGAVATAAPKEPERFDSRLKVGAVPLAITGKDLAGKDVSLDQYKGKVLLVDFWAVWCGPCIAELPNVIAAYEKYHDQGFEILGISLDEANAKAKLETFIAEKKMSWRHIYDGGHWQAANAVAWGVKAIPFTLLIGRDGKIAAVGVSGESLGPAIEAALKGTQTAHGN